MCGIFGFVGSPRRAAGIRLEDAYTALGHRGPDDSGSYRDDGAGPGGCGVACALAHTRLAVIDLSDAARQPMVSPDGRHVLTYNGEVYNFSEIRAELERQGETLRSSGDTEVVLRALSRWGRGALERFRGMFAIALWDATERRLLLVRDRLGVKPLYYVETPDGLAFSSEVRALIETGFATRRLSVPGLRSYLAFGSVAEPHTILEGVRCLEAGTLLEYAHPKASRARYWQLPLGPTERMGFGEAVERVRPVLRDAVRMRLVSDVPFGLFLSGGVDSSALVAFARQAAGGRVRTLTVVFDEKDYSEEAHAARVAGHLGCDHQAIRVSGAEAAATMETALAAMDQPSADGLNTWLISRAARQAGLTVALSGLGGDEVFAGYRSFRSFGRHLVAARIAGLLPSDLRRLAADRFVPGRAPNRLRKGVALLLSGGGPSESYEVLRSMFLREQRRSLLVLRGLEPPPEVFRPLDLDRELARGRLDPVNAYSTLELGNYLRNTLLRDADTMSMAHALEVRVPLVDHVLVETLARVPGHLKLSARENKPLLLAAAPPLPPAVGRRRKMGFSLPFAHWLRGELRPWLEQAVLDGPLARSPLFRPEGLREVWNGFLRGEATMSASRLLCLGTLADWCDRHRVVVE